MTPNISVLLDLPLLRAAYSDRTSWLMARCSQLAYVHFEEDNEPELRGSLKELGLEFQTGFNDIETKTRAFLVTNPRFAVLAFRGTEENMENIRTDIDLRFHKDKNGVKIADGFTRAYARVEKAIANAIDKLDPGLPLYITGHSLGGALAVIASIRITPSDRIAACYTYGCPRVGNAEFTKELWKIPVYRQRHSSDIVSRLPYGFGYKDAGDLRYIKRSQDLVEDPSRLGMACSFLYSFVTNYKSVFLNHRIAGYVDALKAWAIKRNEPAAPAPSQGAPLPKTPSESGGSAD